MLVSDTYKKAAKACIAAQDDSDIDAQAGESSDLPAKRRNRGNLPSRFVDSPDEVSKKRVAPIPDNPKRSTRTIVSSSSDDEEAAAQAKRARNMEVKNKLAALVKGKKISMEMKRSNTAERCNRFRSVERRISLSSEAGPRRRISLSSEAGPSNSRNGNSTSQSSSLNTNFSDTSVPVKVQRKSVGKFEGSLCPC